MSEKSFDPGFCDVCGKPAVHLARDMYNVTTPEDSITRYEPAERIKRGCDEHPVESREIAVSWFAASLGGQQP